MKPLAFDPLTLIRDLTLDEPRWRDVRFYVHELHEKPKTKLRGLSIVAEFEPYAAPTKTASIDIPASDLERLLVVGWKEKIVKLFDEALDRLHVRLFGNPIPKPPKGWRLFGRRPHVVVA